jgi:hypothetical protein
MHDRIRSPERKPGTRITQQFRERHNMTYELECEGATLVVRVFPLEGEPAEWRVEARTTDASDAIVARATASSAAVALERVAAWWRENTATRALSTFDWNAVAEAMTAVRAL